MTNMLRARLAAPSILLAASMAFVLAFAAASQAAVKIQEVKSDKGVTAWLVEDYSVPIVAVQFAFEGGSTQDPVGKEGLANLMTGLFDEGAGDLDSDAFQIKLDDAGAEMSFKESNDAVSGSMRMLADKKDEAFDLLKLAVQQPRFDQAPMDRIRNQIVSGIVASARDPQTLAGRQWAKALYGDHPYARDDQGTQPTLASITRDDLKAFHKANFARDNLRVAVVGAIDADTLKKKLDEVFGDLPEKADLVPVADVDPKLDQVSQYEYDLPQTSLHLYYPGLKRGDSEYLAAALMNQILGGGTFTSRLFQEVREKRGLAYGVNSGLSNQSHSTSLTIGTATRSDRAAEALQVMRDVIRDMAEKGPTQEELDAAKKYVIGAYAINNLDSSQAIAGTLLVMQRDNLGIDYMEKRTALLEAITLDQVKAAAKRLLTTEPAVMILGPAGTLGESKG
ncbi:M16 family metallopeptidase [Oryzicola mucosus]|uniref:Insulinase family protein n=1 Tax=Oryzicola mucosus TaxID=2767425 RepID=A0A8J6PWX9_9HYPH|nr:pitrilysin family protein [Oryzicola mucosus]MBD0415697.1 insulinase family protein [Oryzicola mucosus]